MPNRCQETACIRGGVHTRLGCPPCLRQALRQFGRVQRSHSWAAFVWRWRDRTHLSRRGDGDAPAIREPARAIRRKFREPGVVEREVVGAEHAAPPIVHALVEEVRAAIAEQSRPIWPRRTSPFRRIASNPAASTRSGQTAVELPCRGTPRSAASRRRDRALGRRNARAARLAARAPSHQWRSNSNQDIAGSPSTWPGTTPSVSQRWKLSAGSASGGGYGRAMVLSSRPMRSNLTCSPSGPSIIVRALGLIAGLVADGSGRPAERLGWRSRPAAGSWRTASGVRPPCAEWGRTRL